MLEHESDLLDHLPQPILVLKITDTGSLIVTKANLAYERSTGLSVQNLVGKSYSETVDHTLAQVVGARHLEAIQSKQTIVFEHRIPFTKHPVTAETTITPIIGDTGDVEGLVCSSTDQTPESSTDQTKRKDAIQLDAETFISMAAHDLRTPMRNVKTLAQILLAEPEQRDANELRVLKILEDLACSTSTLISDVLAHSISLDSPGEITSFSFGALCRDLIKSVDPLQVHKIRFASGWIQGDERSFRIILHNLLCEAIDHAEPNRVELNIGLAPISAQNSSLISITAKGDGFPDSMLNFLSGAEMRADNSFGMLGVRRLIRSSGGSITGYRDNETQSAVVTFKMPGLVSFATIDSETPATRPSLKHATHSTPQACPNPSSR